MESTPPRERLWAVQTPQAFQRELYQRALSLAREAGQSYTDDCQLVEAAGCRVKLTYGDYRNLKLTHPGGPAGRPGVYERGKDHARRATGTTSTGWWRGES